jgi:hypothetical protein
MNDVMSLRRKSLVVCAAVALSTLVACQEGAPAGGGTTVDPKAAVLAAMTKAYEAATMHQEFSFEMSAAGESFTFAGEGDVDSERQLISMSMDLGVLGGSVDMVVADGVLYMRSPMFSGSGIRTEWVSMDPAKLDPAMAAQMSGGFGGTNDPSAYVGLFAGVVRVEEDGTETIGGFDTTRYRGTIDIEEVLRRFPDVIGKDLEAETRRQVEEGLERTLEQFETLGVDGRVPFVIWIDEEGYPRRQVITMDFTGIAPGGEDASMRLRADYSAFGEPVEVEVPPERRVTDITSMMKHAGGMNAASDAA